MELFEKIYKRAVRRKGGEQTLEALLPKAKTKRQLQNISDDRYLSALSKCVFQAGFNWKVVDNKWKDFETVFKKFDLAYICNMADEHIEALMQDKRVIRNYKKLKSIRDNAFLINDIARKNNSFGHFISNWPDEQLIDLAIYFKKHAQRVGLRTAQYFLRTVGRDVFLLSREAVNVLINNKVITRQPSTLKEFADIQTAFNQWKLECERPFCEISKIIACSID